MTNQQTATAVPQTPDDVFAALFRAHFTAIRRFAERRLPTYAAAEDVASETFAAAWKVICTGGAVDPARSTPSHHDE